MQVKEKILVIYIHRSSFVEQDIDALRTNHDVVEFEFGMNKGFSMLKAQWKLLKFLILNAHSFKMIYCWFADYHCLIPSLFRLFSKFRFVIAIGGFDAIKIPEFRYGAHLSLIRSKIIILSIKKADLLVCSSNFVLESLIQTTAIQSLKNKSITVYPGIDCSKKSLNDSKEKDVLMIYVSAGETLDRMKIKGVDRFLELVAANKNERFILIGPTLEALAWSTSLKLPNLEIISKINREALNEYYNRSKYIGLFSRFEAFGMVVLEGMCNGCIPLVLSSNGSAEILKNPNAPGHIFDQFDVLEISKYIQSSDHKIQTMEAIHDYLANHFPSNARAKQLKTLLN